jgi:lysozyme
MVPRLAVVLAQESEGFHRVVARTPVVTATPYICPAGYWTIGYGHLCPQDHPAITLEEGEAYLEQDMQTALAAALRHCPGLAVEPERRLAAIVDFTFNLGAGRLQTSTLRRRVNQRDWSGAAYEIRRWVRGGGRVLPGLVRRREVEAGWLLS